MSRLPSKLLCLLFTIVVYAVGFFSAVHTMTSNGDVDRQPLAPPSILPPTPLPNNLLDVQRGVKNTVDGAMGGLHTTLRKDRVWGGEADPFKSQLPVERMSPYDNINNPVRGGASSSTLAPRAPEAPPERPGLAAPFVASLPYPAPPCDPIENPSDLQVTLVSSASMDRISSISAFCSTWSGPISVVFYTSLPPPTVDLKVRSLPSCGVGDDSRITVTTRTPTREEEEDPRLFPVNELRNLAIEAVKTTHYVYIDVDFYPSDKILETILSPPAALVLASSYKSALVIPAFERSYLTCSPRNYDLSEGEKREFQDCVSKLAMPSDMQDLKKQMKKRMTRVFDGRFTSVPHSSTGYNEWFKQEVGELRDIKCIDSDRYEPYLVLRKCASLPPFQPSFTGYGKNKASHTLHLRYLSYDLKRGKG
ncbi:hypothetical protein TrRE_jg2426 [Triparma retinervis]|uniref:Uncharacterized protein n=1 Tax=Triparma retinervis TaxID=2557542 RepID=A0A9W7FAS9_9STRA|nr:hypothetical protein TrRE_jg2426 [Triparma retinervis]